MEFFSDMTKDFVTITTAAAEQPVVASGRVEIVAVIIDTGEAGATLELLDKDLSSYGIKPGLDNQGRMRYNLQVENGLAYTSVGLTGTGRVHLAYRPLP